MSGQRAYSIDNTVPQSASLFFLTGADKHPLESHANLCFEQFVNAYINRPALGHSLPGTSAGDGDKLMELWFAAAKPNRVSNAAAGYDSSSLWKSDELILDEFTDAFRGEPENWARFARYQLSPEIGRQYASRVQDWRTRLHEAGDVNLADAIISAPGGGAASPLVGAIRTGVFAAQKLSSLRRVPSLH